MDTRVRDQARAAVREHVLTRADTWSCVAAYVPLRTEPGSVELLAALTDAGVEVLVPITLADRDLDWARWQSGKPLGRDAIARVDAVLVPALAVSRAGTRLGRGGGSYDRALLRCRAGTLVAALLFDGEVRDELPHEPWDQPVGAAVTPAGWIELASAG